MSAYLPRRNILPHINSSYLKRCEFNRKTDPHCPIFRLKHIVSEAGEEFQDMAVKVEFSITPKVFRNVNNCIKSSLHTYLSLIAAEFQSSGLHQ